MTQSIFGITFSWLHDLTLPSITVGPTQSSSTPTQLNISNYLRDTRRIRPVSGLIGIISSQATKDLSVQQKNTILEYMLLFSQFEAYFYSSASDAALVTIKSEAFKIDSIYEKINKLIELYCDVHDNNLLKTDYLEKSYMFIICIIVKTIKNINESLDKLNDIKSKDHGEAFQLKLKQFNQDTANKQITDLDSFLKEIQKSYQASNKDKNIEKIILMLIKYGILPTSILHKSSDISSSVDNTLPSAFTIQALPSHIFDMLIEKIDMGEVNHEDAFEIIRLLINTPELKIEGIHHSVHYALVLLIAVHARTLCQLRTAALPLSSSSASHMFETSAQTIETFISIPDTLCVDLILLLHTKKAHEFMLLFSIYHQQLSHANISTTYLQNQLSLMLVESFQKMVRIKIKESEVKPLENQETKTNFFGLLGELFAQAPKKSDIPVKPDEIKVDFHTVKYKMLDILEKLFLKLSLHHAQVTIVQRLNRYCDLLKSEHTAIDIAPKQSPIPASSSTLSSSHTSGPRLGLNASGLYTPPALPSVIYLRTRRLLNQEGIAALSKINETTGETPLIAVVNEFCLETLALIADYCNDHEQNIHDILAKHIDAKNNNLLHYAIMRSSSAPMIYRMPEVRGEVGDEITLDIQLKFYQTLIKFGVNPQQKNQIDKTPTAMLDETSLSDETKTSIKAIFEPAHQVRLQ